MLSFQPGGKSSTLWLRMCGVEYGGVGAEGYGELRDSGEYATDPAMRVQIAE